MNSDVALTLAVLAAAAVGFPLLIVLIHWTLSRSLDDLDARDAELKRIGDARDRLETLRVRPKHRRRALARRRRPSSAPASPPEDELLERCQELLEGLGAQAISDGAGVACQLDGLEWTVRAKAAPASAAPKGIPGESLEVHVAAGAPSAQGFRLRVRPRADISDDELAFLEVRRVGRKAFDKRFVIESPDRTAIDTLRAGGARKACAQVFGVPGIKALTLGDGWVHATGVIRSGIGRKKLRSLLKGVRSVAEALGHPRTVTLRSATPAAGPGEAARCPFCHDALARDDECLSCDTCGTVLHTECHRELLGRCPVLGCEGGSTSLVPRVSS